MMRVLLDAAQMQRAMEAGRRRQENAERKGIPDAHGFKGNGLEIHQKGCKAELAVAVALGFEEQWIEFALDFKALPDDVPGLQVRSTSHHAGRLLVHKRDQDDKPFVLVRTDQEPMFSIVGWIPGKDAKDPKYWKELQRGRPCFVIDTWDLHPLEELNV